MAVQSHFCLCFSIICFCGRSRNFDARPRPGWVGTVMSSCNNCRVVRSSYTFLLTDTFEEFMHKNIYFNKKLATFRAKNLVSFPESCFQGNLAQVGQGIWLLAVFANRGIGPFRSEAGENDWDTARISYSSPHWSGFESLCRLAAVLLFSAKFFSLSGHRRTLIGFPVQSLFRPRQPAFSSPLHLSFLFYEGVIQKRTFRRSYYFSPVDKPPIVCIIIPRIPFLPPKDLSPLRAR